MKPAYSYYTDKMWRYFIPRLESSRESGIKPVFHNKIEQENYVLCDLIWSGLSPTERDVMTVIYSIRKDSLDDAIGMLAAKHSLSAQAVWSIAHRIGRQLGIRKGLVAEQGENAYPSAQNGAEDK